MNDVTAMRALRRKVDEISERLAVATVPDQLQPVLRRARTLAAELRLATAREITVGFAGFFTVGKSLLVSLLAGRPDLLYVANAPATGNVTRIRLRSVPAGTPPGPPVLRISLLSPDAVAEMCGFILTQIIDLVGRDPRRAHEVRDLVGYQPVDVTDPGRSDWGRLADYLRPRWRDQSMNPEIRQWATELLAIRDAYQAGGHLLPRSMPGPETRVGSFGEAVAIGDSRQPRPDFPEQVFRLPLGNDLDDPRTLAAIFPLVHEVIVEVDLPADVWPLGGLDRLDLLDFPGLGSGSQRDRFLAERELAGTTVVAVVLDAEKPKSADVDGLYGPLERYRRNREHLGQSILVVANRFDRVKPPGRLPDGLAALAAGSADFRNLRDVAGELTRDRFDRMTLVSTLAAAIRSGYVPPGCRPQDVQAAGGTLATWGTVADAVAARDPGNPATHALEGFRRDGGLAYTRALITRHVGEYGMRIWLDEARRREEELDQLLQRLDRQHRSGGPDRERLTSFLRDLRVAHRRIHARTAELQLPQQLPYRGSTVGEAIRDEAVHLVHDWNQWQATRQEAVFPRQRRPQAQPAGQPGYASGLRRPGERNPRPGPPEPVQTWLTTTRDLDEPYRKALARLAERATAILTEALRERSATLHRESGAARLAAGFAGPDGTRGPLHAYLEDTYAHEPESAEYRLDLVEFLLDPAAVADRVAPEAEAVGPPGGRFPLSANRALPWHHERAARLGHDPVQTDLLQIDRICRDVVLGLHADVCRYLRAVTERVHGSMALDLDDFDAYVPTAADVDRHYDA